MGWLCLIIVRSISRYIAILLNLILCPPLNYLNIKKRCSALGGFPDLKRHRAYRLKAPSGRWRVSAVQEAISPKLVRNDVWQDSTTLYVQAGK